MMRIASSTIAMTSQHTLVQRDEQSGSLRFWKGNRENASQQNSPLQQLIGQMQQDILDISNDSKKMLREQVRSLAKIPQADKPVVELSDEDEQRIQLIQDFIEALTGKKIKIFVFKPQDLKTAELDLKNAPQQNASQQNAASEQPQQRYGWGLAYDYHQMHYEQEQTTFSAAGVVKTADGKEIDFTVAVNMSREFMTQQNISVRAGDAAIDPLVINFDGPAASLTQTKFSFDLDTDGKAEQISFVNPGSGFLTLDKNGDGKVNDGAELFGPESGNGFAELTAYDSDGNNWIDENDPIYDQLRIWTKDAAGNDQLFALGQKGIGAIFLGNVNTPFAIKTSSNELQGQVQRSGVFLRENGSAGVIQQVDLAV